LWKSLYDCRSDGQYVLVSNTLVGLATRYYFLSECWCLKFAVLYLLGASLSRGREEERVTLRLTVSQSICLGIEHPCGTCDQILLVQGRSYFTTDGQSVSHSASQYVLASSTLVGLATRYYFLSECYCLKFAVLYLLGTLSDERTGLQFAV
jgi:hypothetical protein